VILNNISQTEMMPTSKLRIPSVGKPTKETTMADERTCITSRVYPTLSTSTGLDISVQNGSAKLRRLSVWQMSSIWEKASEASKSRGPLSNTHR
jgi:hypothetical protein